MSAGTIIASHQDRQSSLGPVDPIVNGIQAYWAIEGIPTAYQDIMKDKNKIFGLESYPLQVR
jgi:hypothetical protein